MSTVSVDIDRLNLRQLLQVSNHLTRQADMIREQRMYLKKVIDERIALGETEHDLVMNDTLNPSFSVDAVAEGVVLVTKPNGLTA